MKKRKYYILLAVTVTATLALLGVAVGFWVLRPNDNYHHPLPMSLLSDCMPSAVYLFLAAFVCFFGGAEIRFLDYDEQKEDL